MVPEEIEDRFPNPIRGRSYLQPFEGRKTPAPQPTTGYSHSESITTAHRGQVPKQKPSESSGDRLRDQWVSAGLWAFFFIEPLRFRVPEASTTFLPRGLLR